MSQSLYTAAAGLKAQQQKIDTIANNIANINTTGFRRNRLDFEDAVYTAMQNAAQPANSQTGNLQLGSGSIASEIRQIFTAGPLQQTSRPLDLALSTEGFFASENPAGSVFYTRDGSFQTQVQNGLNYLMTSNGQYVLDKNGRQISSSQSFEQMAADAAGNLSIGNDILAQIGVFTFQNPDGLENAGSNSFLATNGSGPAISAKSKIQQGFLEGSNVDLTEEMTQLIDSQRAYAFISRAITTADEMRSIENDIRR